MIEFIYHDQEYKKVLAMAQAPHIPTDEMRLKITGACLTGATQVMISKMLKINEETLVKYYGDILANAVSDKTVEVVNSLLYNCIEKKKEASIFFWLKCRARWKEQPVDESNLKPEPVKITFNVQPAVGEIKVTKGSND